MAPPVNFREVSKWCVVSVLNRLQNRIQNLLPEGFAGLAGFFLPWRGGIDCRPDGDGPAAAGDLTGADGAKMVQPFERLLNGTAADVALEEAPDLYSGEAAFRGLKGFVDAIGDGVSDAGAEEECRGAGTVVPQSKSGFEVRQADQGAAVERGVESAEAQYLGFGTTRGRAVDRIRGLTQSCIVAVPEFAGFLVTAEDVRHGKPAPDGYLMAARALGVAATDCVVVEDSPAGVEAGKAAGALVAAVTTTHPADALRAADLVVAGLPEVAEVAEALGYSCSTTVCSTTTDQGGGHGGT